MKIGFESLFWAGLGLGLVLGAGVGGMLGWIAAIALTTMGAP